MGVLNDCAAAFDPVTRVAVFNSVQSAAFRSVNVPADDAAVTLRGGVASQCIAKTSDVTGQ